MPVVLRELDARVARHDVGVVLVEDPTRFARDLKHLMALLDRLDEFSLATKRAITVPLLKKMLAEEGAA